MPRKVLTALSIALALGLPPAARAGEAVPSSAIGISQGLIDALSDLPGASSARGLVEDYRRIIRPDAYMGRAHKGDENSGLNQYLSAAGKKDPTFVEHAREFYAEIKKLDGTRGAAGTNWRDPLTRPKLLERAGQGRYADLSPGWLWDLALRHARGDANGAVRLIGLCGHDDVNQKGAQTVAGLSHNEGKYVAKTEKLRAEVEESLAGISELRGMDLPCATKDRLLLQVHEQLRHAQFALDFHQNHKEKFVEESTVACPGNTSAFYVPGALGADADIPETLKQKVLARQAPAGSAPDLADKIAAKHYHVYGAMLVACEMIARGHSPAVVRQLSGVAGYLYRSERMSGLATELARKATRVPPTRPPAEDVERAYANYLEQIRAAARDPETASKGMDCPMCPAKPTDGDDTLSLLLAIQVKKALLTAPLPREQFVTEVLRDADRAVHEAAVENEERDALLLMRRWTISRKLKLPWRTYEVPYTSIRLELPEALQDSAIDRLIHAKPAAWSEERFTAAKRRFRSFIVDWEWTSQQHLEGGRFAAEHCHSEVAK